MAYKDILEKLTASVEKFNENIPKYQKGILSAVMEELRKLNTDGDKIKPVVENIKRIASIKNKMNNILVTSEYKEAVKAFAGSFREITTLQNEYWRTVEKDFSPKTLLKEIKNQSVQDTVVKLTEAGIGVGVGDKIAEILRTNITTGGSYKKLSGQLRESLTDTDKSVGTLSKYAKQITTDSIHQFNAQYTQVISNDLGYEWFAWQGSEIETSREFCQSMVENKRYFHISEVPAMLRAEDMVYTDDEGNQLPVRINPKTNLPHGFIDGTTVENFFIRRGGYNCGHQARPVSNDLVESVAPAAFLRVTESAAYKAWAKGKPQKKAPETPVDAELEKEGEGAVATIRSLFDQGKSNSEIIALGYNKNTVGVQRAKWKKEQEGKTAAKPVEPTKPVEPVEPPVAAPLAPKNQIAFKAATTRSEAEEFLIKNGLAQEANYRYVPLDFANQINKQLLELKNKYGSSFRSIRPSFDSTDSILSTSKDGDLTVYTDPIFKAGEELGAFNKKIATLHKSGWFNSENLDDIVIHEFGHLLSQKKLDSSGAKVDAKFRTSKYSGLDEHETMAEMFVLLHKGKGTEEMYDEFNKYSEIKISSGIAKPTQTAVLPPGIFSKPGAMQTVIAPNEKVVTGTVKRFSVKSLIPMEEHAIGSNSTGDEIAKGNYVSVDPATGKEIRKKFDALGNPDQLPPILISKDGKILDGHNRYYAANKVGMTELNAIVVDQTYEEFYGLKTPAKPVELPTVKPAAPKPAAATKLLTNGIINAAIREAYKRKYVSPNQVRDWPTEKLNAAISDVVAGEAVSRIPGAKFESSSDKDMSDYQLGEPHYWFSLNGKHYDMEAPDGVDNWRDLPRLKRSKIPEGATKPAPAPTPTPTPKPAPTPAPAGGGGKIAEIIKLLKEGKTKDEIIAMGYSKSTVGVQASKLKAAGGNIAKPAAGVPRAAPPPKPTRPAFPAKLYNSLYGKGEVSASAPVDYKFTPAKTVKEAEEFARSLGALEVNYSKVPLEFSNNVNEQLLQLKQKYGYMYRVIKFMDIPAEKGRGETNAQNRNLGGGDFGLEINSLRIKRVGTLEKWNKEKLESYNTGWSNGKNLQDTIIHEYGHLLTVNKLNDSEYRFTKMNRKFQTSTYSKHNSAETLAEMFLLMHKKKLDLDFYTEFNKFVKPGVKVAP